MNGYAPITAADEAAISPDDLVLATDPHVGDLPCPHCRQQTWRRSSRKITPTYREILYYCRNAACGHTFVASLSYLYGLSPSAIPDPAVDLPLRPMERSPALCAHEATGPPPDPRQPGLFE